MTPYLQVTQALVTAGVLSAADVVAAVAVLVNTMRISGVKHQEIMASDDMLTQRGMITEAKAEAAAAVDVGDDDALAYQESIIERAEKTEIQDREIIDSARDAIAASSRDAAAALVAAGLVDAACLEDTINVIGHARW